jgi:hypothetical protein
MSLFRIASQMVHWIFGGQFFNQTTRVLLQLINWLIVLIDEEYSRNILQFSSSVFGSVVMVAFQIAFRTKIHANDVFLFFKNHF